MLIFLWASVAMAAPQNVLVTAFEPFGGRKVNGSELVARELVKSSDGKINYTLCVLPVEYERGAEAAKKCFAELKHKPDLVLSTGEGDCSIRVETRAHNLDHTPGFPDNGGLERKKHVIEPRGPFHLKFSWPAARMVCAAESVGNPVVRASVSPGYFVCNATAYRLGRFFAAQKIPFGFVHLPVAETCGVEPATSAKLLAKIAVAALGKGEGKANGACVVAEEAKLRKLRKSYQRP